MQVLGEIANLLRSIASIMRAAARVTAGEFPFSNCLIKAILIALQTFRLEPAVARVSRC